MSDNHSTPWLQPRPFCEGEFRKKAIEKFDSDPSGDRSHYLDLLGQFLDIEKPIKLKTIPELRKFIQGQKREFPKNAGAYRILIPIVRGVILNGIDYFPQKVRKTRKGKRKAKLDYETILERAERGESISKIAQDAEISRSRVRQIIKSEVLQSDISERVN